MRVVRFWELPSLLSDVMSRAQLQHLLCRKARESGGTGSCARRAVARRARTLPDQQHSAANNERAGLFSYSTIHPSIHSVIMINPNHHPPFNINSGEYLQKPTTIFTFYYNIKLLLLLLLN